MAGKKKSGRSKQKRDGTTKGTAKRSSRDLVSEVWGFTKELRDLEHQEEHIKAKRSEEMKDIRARKKELRNYIDQAIEDDQTGQMRLFSPPDGEEEPSEEPKPEAAVVGGN